jgi:hypothetical protein
LDETSGKPIPNAEVLVLCWYSHNFDDASYHKQILITDSKGKYQATLWNDQLDLFAIRY